MKITPARALEDLGANSCSGCGKKKRPGASLCGACYGALPRTMKLELYRGVGGGYEEAYARALMFLAGPTGG